MSGAKRTMPGRRREGLLSLRRNNSKGPTTMVLSTKYLQQHRIGTEVKGGRGTITNPKSRNKTTETIKNDNPSPSWSVQAE